VIQNTFLIAAGTADMVTCAKYYEDIRFGRRN